MLPSAQCTDFWRDTGNTSEKAPSLVVLTMIIIQLIEITLLGFQVECRQCLLCSWCTGPSLKIVMSPMDTQDDTDWPLSAVLWGKTATKPRTGTELSIQQS